MLLTGVAPSVADSIPLGPADPVQPTVDTTGAAPDTSGQVAGDETILNGGILVPAPVLSKGLSKKMATAGGVSSCELQTDAHRLLGLGLCICGSAAWGL